MGPQSLIPDLESPRDILDVRGGRELDGEVRAQGFKHCLVTAVAAGLLANGPLHLRNCPDIEETRVLAAILRDIGATASRHGDSLTISGADAREHSIDAELAARIHGSVYLLPGLLARFGVGRVGVAGGCRIGSSPSGARPSDHYLDVLRRFGADAEYDQDGGLTARAKRLRAIDIDLRDYSLERGRLTGPLYSGATKFAILAAVVARGVSRIRWPYPKPDVSQLVQCLQQIGFQLSYDSPRQLTITGCPDLLPARPAQVRLIGDLIEIMTYVCTGVLYGQRVVVTGFGDSELLALKPELSVLERMNAAIETGGTQQGRWIAAWRSIALRSAEIDVFPEGIYSDCQPLFALLASHATGRTVIRDFVWPNRFGYARGLRELGVNISSETTGQAEIVGPCPPFQPGRTVVGLDLRAAATLVLASLGIRGRTTIHGASHLDRGYRDLPRSLRSLGARIDRR